MSDLWGHSLRILAVLALVTLNGFFVAAEFALVSVRKTRIEQLSQEGNRRAKSVLRALEHLDTYIAATQLGITMASLALGFIGEPAMAGLVEPIFAMFLPPRGAVITSHGVALVIAFGLATALHIVIGELAPKSIALSRPVRTALWVTTPLDLFLKLFRPFILALNTTGNAVVKVIGIEPSGSHTSVHSVEELELLVHSTREAGLLEAQQEQMVAGVFDFEDTVVRKLMTPRLDITAIEADVEAKELVRIVTESGHSRLPVYDDILDNIIGVLHVKDALTRLVSGSSDVRIRDLMRPPYFVPENKRAGFLLAELRRRKLPMAIVRDEYGVVTGVVTVEDLLEEIVGDIQDEHDTDEEPPIQVLDATTTLLDGKMSLNDVNERMGLELPEDEADTIGGLVFSLLGHRAEAGEEVAWENVTFIVEATDGRRITKVRLIQSPRPKETDEGAESSEPSETNTPVEAG